MASSASLECHILFDTVFVGLITSTGYGPERAQHFADQFHEAITILYNDNLAGIRTQGNLRPNCLDKTFIQDFRKIYKNNDTGINMGVIGDAQSQVDDI